MNVRFMCLAFVSVLTFVAGAGAGVHDWVQIYQHSGEGGASLRCTLPAPGTNFLTGIDCWVGSVRRIGPQLRTAAGGALYHGASSMRVWAAETGVAVYLFEGDNFNGSMLRFHVPKGYTQAWNLGWFSDKLGSFIAVREKVASSLAEQLTDTPIPLDDLVSKVRDAFSAQLDANSRVEEFWLHDTQVNYDTAHSLWLELGASTDYWAKYHDIVRIKQEIEIDPNWWAFNYDTWVKLGYYFHTDSAQHLAFSWCAWAVWVEGGVIHGQIEEALASAIGASVEATGNEIRDGIRTAIQDVAGAFAAQIWNGVAKVGWNIPCDSFNNLSGFSRPAEPYCWSSSSRKEMFPPTLILHHNPNDP